jgi:hypothetical protein
MIGLFKKGLNVTIVFPLTVVLCFSHRPFYFQLLSAHNHDTKYNFSTRPIRKFLQLTWGCRDVVCALAWEPFYLSAVDRFHL